MVNKYAEFEGDCFYHVYNRANGDEKMFRSDENYDFFLKQYVKYTHPFVETYCYCLMPNHFHFLIKIKNEQTLNALLKLDQDQDLPGFKNLAGLGLNLNSKMQSKYISKQFSNFFNSYTKAFNKMYHRKGSLFMKPFKRKKVENEAYLKKLVHYIHYNPVESGLVNLTGDWKHSSYKTIISSKQSPIIRNQVIELFEDKQNFIYCHKLASVLSGID